MADINVKMATTGVAQFKKDINNSKITIKELNSEMKLAEANYKASGNAQEYAKEKARILTEQIKQQEQIVNSTKAALEKMTKSGVDPSSAAYQKWKGQLAESLATLTTMRSDLAETNASLDDQGNALKGAGDQAGEYKNQLDNINKNVSFDAVINGINKVTEKMEAAARRVAQLAKSIWEFESDSSDWADQLLTEAAQNGLSTTELQQMRYASRLVDAETDDILAARDKITKAINADRDASVLELFTGGNISVKDAAGEYRSLNDIFTDTVRAISAITNETERDAAAQEVFGKSFRNVATLFKEGAIDDYNAAMAEAPVVSEENVAALGNLNDSLQTLEAQWEKMKLDVAGSMADGFSKIATSLSSVISSIDEFAQSEEGKAALKNFSEAIASIVTNFTDPEQIKTGIEKVTGAIESLTGALDWISKNGNTVTGIITALGAAFGGLKIAEGVLEFLRLIQGAKGFNFFGNNGTPNTNPTPGADPFSNAAGGAAINELAKKRNWLSKILDKAAPAFSGIDIPNWAKIGSIASLWKLAKDTSEMLPGGSNAMVRMPDGSYIKFNDIKTIPADSEVEVNRQAQKIGEEAATIIGSTAEEETENLMADLEKATKESGASVGEAGGASIDAALAEGISANAGLISDALDGVLATISSKLALAMDMIGSLSTIGGNGKQVTRNFNSTTNLNINNMNMGSGYDAGVLLTTITNQNNRQIHGVGGKF